MYSLPTNIQNMTGLLDWSMEVTGNQFGHLLLLAIFMVMFITFKRYTTERAFGVATFTVWALAWPFRWLGLISDLVFFAVLIVGGSFGLVWLYLANRQPEG